MANFNGTLGNNNLTGTADEDVINGLAGNDLLNGLDGDDSLNGDSGSDTLFGGSDDDTVLGSSDDDSLIGGLNNDLLLGGSGSDRLIGVDPDLGFGTGEIDTLTGGGGSDTLVLGAPTRIFYDDEGNSDFALINNFNNFSPDFFSQDFIELPIYITEIGDAGQLLPNAQVIPEGTRKLDFINGTISSENDVDLFQITVDEFSEFSATTVDGADFNTQLFLFDENGLLVDQNDNVSSGNQSTLPTSPSMPVEPGNYFLAISSFNNDPVGAPLSGFTGNGNSRGSYTIALTGVVGADPFSFGASPAGLPEGTAISFEDDLIAIVQGVATINGTSGNNNLTGTAVDNIINGLAGNDLLNGLDDDDTLNGDSGSDTLFGGADNDSLDGGTGSDRLNGGNGDDSLIGGFNNDLLLGGNGSDRLIGTDLDSGVGKGEIDTLIGGGGSDTFVIGQGFDEVFYDDEGNSDFALIDNFNSSQDSIALPSVPEDFSVTEIDDAGQLLPNAQVIPAGTATLDLIAGTISSENDVDLFQITLDEFSEFSATTVEGADFDTQLFLFDENGLLVDQNDDVSSGNQSTLSASPSTPLESGTYFLAISSFNNDGAPLSGFTGNGNSSGSYTIALTGVQANPFSFGASPIGLPKGTAISFENDLIAIVQGVSIGTLTDDVIIPSGLVSKAIGITPLFAFDVPGVEFVP